MKHFFLKSVVMAGVFCGVAFAQDSPTANEDLASGKTEGVFAVVATCNISRKEIDLNRLGFWESDDKPATIQSVEIQVQQLFPTSSAVVSFRPRLQVLTFDKKGNKISEKTVWRIVVHKLGRTLSVSYDPDGGSTDGFLLSIGAEQALFNYTPIIQRGVGLAQRPVEIECQSGGIYRAPGEKGTVAREVRGTNVQKARSLDTFIDNRAWSYTYETHKKFKMTDKEWENHVADLAKTIEKQNGGKACGKPRVENFYEAKNADGDTLGSRLDISCTDILTADKDDWMKRYIGTSFYYDENLREITLSSAEQPKRTFSKYN